MPRPAVFLDRDGVLNRRRLFLVRRPADFELVPGALEAVRRLREAGYAIVVATNQPAVAWGLLSPEDLAAIHERLRREAAEAGGGIDRIEACAHAPSEDCPCRKPKPGMLLAAAQALDLDLPASWMVGDQRKDLLAGKAAGCRTVLVNPTVRARITRASDIADLTAANLSGAVEGMLRKPSRG